MRFDDILQYLGDFGPYQKRIYFLLCIHPMFVAFHKLSWVFVGAVPEHRCRLIEDGINGTSATFQQQEFILKARVPWDSLNERWSRCEMYSYDSNSTGGHNEIFKTIKTCDSWVYDYSQYQSTVVTEFDLVCHRNWMRAISYTFFTVGEFLGAVFIGGILSDRFGRRKIFVLCLIGEGISGILVGLIHNYYAFVVLRVCVGIFMQAGMLTAYVLGLEFVGPSKREFVGIAVCYSFAFGYALTAAVAYGLRDWYALQLAIAVPMLLYWICIRWIPESARWLLSVNRPKEAMAIVQKAAKVNKVELPAVLLETESKEKADTVLKCGPLDLLRTRAGRKVVFVLGFTWFVNSAVYYGLSLNTSNLGGNDYLNFLIAAVIEFPAYALCVWSLEHFGRRLPTCLSMAVGGIGLVSTLFVPKDMTVVVITLAMIGKFGITVSYAIIYVFSAELVPTPVRNLCMGINSTCARIGSMCIPFILLLADYWRPLPLIVLGTMSLLSGLLVLVLPETHRRALPETMMDVGNMKLQKYDVAPVTSQKMPEDNEPKVELLPGTNNLNNVRNEPQVDT